MSCPLSDLINELPLIPQFRTWSEQGGITCGAIDEPRISSKAINERVIINFRDKNVVIARFRDKNVVIARFRDKNVVIAHFCKILPLKKRVNRDKCSFATKQRMFGVFAIDEILRYRGTRFPGSRTLCHPARHIEWLHCPGKLPICSVVKGDCYTFQRQCNDQISQKKRLT